MEVNSKRKMMLMKGNGKPPLLISCLETSQGRHKLAVTWWHFTHKDADAHSIGRRAECHESMMQLIAFAPKCQKHVSEQHFYFTQAF